MEKMRQCSYYNYDRCHAQKGFPCTSCNGDQTECELDTPISYLENPITIFKKNLVIHLKDYLYAYVKVYIKNDDLQIELYHNHNLDFMYTEYSISSKIISGLNSKELAIKIVKKYKSVLLHRHFKTEIY